MAAIQNKDSDILPKENEDEMEMGGGGSGEEENYEVDENDYFTTLRKSAAFTIEKLSQIY